MDIYWPYYSIFLIHANPLNEEHLSWRENSLITFGFVCNRIEQAYMQFHRTNNSARIFIN